MRAAPLNLVLAGVGGQGNVLLSQLIAWTALDRGYRVSVGETFGASQRGGPVLSHVRIGSEQVGPLIPASQAHLLIGLEPLETVRAAAKYVHPEGTILMNTRSIYPADVLAGLHKYPEMEAMLSELRKLCRTVWTVNAVSLAHRAGNPLAMNIVTLGALAASKLTPFPLEEYRSVVQNRLSKFRRINLKAFDFGAQAFLKSPPAARA